MNCYVSEPPGVVRAVADVLEWGRWFEGTADVPFAEGGRRVAEDWPQPDVRVSTVFLGLDHSFGFGPPLLFESMIFGIDGDTYQEWYTTYDQAKEGHARAVARAKGTPP